MPDPARPTLELQYMERLGTFEAANAKVLADAQRCIERIKALCAQSIATADDGVRVLRVLREEAYEDLHQIQHEHLILHAAQWLIQQKHCSNAVEWSWNPRQTGDDSEPDLWGFDHGSVAISAEITTSREPVGVIDTRMRKTLSKLAQTEGRKFYFVRTESMRRRAATKVAKAGWPIQVVLLEGPSVAL